MANDDQILGHMNSISQALIKAGISSMCLYASVLLKERLAREGIFLTLVSGYLQTDRQHGEIFRHVWLENNGKRYDVSIKVLKKVSWNNVKVKFKHHETLPSNLRHMIKSEPALEYGIRLYQSDPYKFWSEFDNCDQPQLHRHIAPVINQLRDAFLD